MKPRTGNDIWNIYLTSGIEKQETCVEQKDRQIFLLK